jgi:hypothetical protein
MCLKKTNLQFVEQANKIHRNKYKYPYTYCGDSIKIGIECPIHGIFEQIPSSHLQGCGCPNCAIEYRKNLFRKSSEDFIKKANIIHNNKYIYLEDYKGSKIKIKIHCKIHDMFLQTPDKHLQGNGCPKCAGTVKKTKLQFVKEANAIHNDKYTYPGEYLNARTDIEISCRKHGSFWQCPDSYLNGVGCPTCSSNSSKPEMEWLDSLGISNDNIHRHCRIYMNDSYIKPDGFDPQTNTIYEFYGDYFHGNPKIYDAETMNHKNNKRCGDLYKDTMVREKMIKNAGYNLVSIWESDWKNKNEK